MLLYIVCVFVSFCGFFGFVGFCLVSVSWWGGALVTWPVCRWRRGVRPAAASATGRRGGGLGRWLPLLHEPTGHTPALTGAEGKHQPTNQPAAAGRRVTCRVTWPDLTCAQVTARRPTRYCRPSWCCDSAGSTRATWAASAPCCWTGSPCSRDRRCSSGPTSRTPIWPEVRSQLQPRLPSPVPHTRTAHCTQPGLSGWSWGM